MIRAVYLVFLAITLAACGEDPAPEGDGGSAGEGVGGQVASTEQTGGGYGGEIASGGDGAAPPTLHEVEIALLTPPHTDPSQVLVIWSSVDGEVKGTHRGDELPIIVTASDGDLVTYLVRSLGSIEEVTSYRVRPEVTRIETQAAPLQNVMYCQLDAPMDVVVSVPDVPGSVWIQSGTGHFGSVLDPPGDSVVRVNMCEGSAQFDMLVFGRSNGELLSYELIPDIPYEPGTSISLTPTVADTTRRPLRVEVSEFGEANYAYAHAEWYGNALLALPGSGGQEFALILPEWHEWLPTEGPFSYSANILSAPHGYPVAYIDIYFEEDEEGWCSGASFARQGESDEVFSFKPRQLAQPQRSADGLWTLAPEGEVGTLLEQFQVQPANVWWTVYDDPAYEPLPVLLPSVDESALPLDVRIPAPFEARWTAHRRTRELATYAKVVANAQNLSTTTITSRSSYRCDD